MNTLWLENLAAFSLQIALVAALIAAAVALGRVRSPRVLLRFHQAALAIALVAPLLQPWRRIEAAKEASLEVGAGAWISSLAEPVAGFDVPTIAAYVLAAGVLVRIGWLALGCWRLARYRRTASPLARTLVDRVDPGNRLVGRIRWLVSPDIQGPATYGLLNPVVLVPSELHRQSADSARSILVHELVHVRRHDWLLVLIEELVRGALWFHPGIWWLLDRIHLHREQTVDEEVIAVTGDRRGYLAALLESAGGPAGIEASPAPAWLRRRHLKARVLSAIKEAPMSRRRLYWSTASLAVVLMLAATAAAFAFPIAAPGAARQPVPQVYEPGNGVTLPQLVKEVRPQYTPAAMAAGIQGTVLLGCVVQDNGRVGEITLLRSLDAEHGLDEQAREAASQWEFEPGTKDGKPVAVRVTIEIRFTLKK